jgi:hypothetical protein
MWFKEYVLYDMINRVTVWVSSNGKPHPDVKIYKLIKGGKR